MSNSVLFVITALMSAIALNAADTNAASLPTTGTPVKKESDFRSFPEDGLKWRRDPFISSGTQKNDAQKLKTTAAKKAHSTSADSVDINLQGIMQADRAFHALIDGRVYKKGDKIGGLTIIEISRYCVVVQNELKEKITHDIHKGKISRGEK